jgi:hypothetical protein
MSKSPASAIEPSPASICTRSPESCLAGKQRQRLKHRRAQTPRRACAPTALAGSGHSSAKPPALA